MNRSLDSAYQVPFSCEKRMEVELKMDESTQVRDTVAFRFITLLYMVVHIYAEIVDLS